MTITIATITDIANTRQRDAWLVGKAIKVIGFVLSDNGVDPLNPALPLATDPSILVAPSPITFGPKAISGAAIVESDCPIYECFLDYGDALLPYSQLTILAAVLWSPISSDPQLNVSYPWATVNFARRYKSDQAQLTEYIGVQR